MKKIIFMFLILVNSAQASNVEIYTSIQSPKHTRSKSDYVAKTLYSKAYRELMDFCMDSADRTSQLVNQRISSYGRDLPPRMVLADFILNDNEVVSYKSGQKNKNDEPLYVSVIHMSGNCKINIER